MAVMLLAGVSWPEKAPALEQGMQPAAA
jgi:hypothetical protein